MSANSEPDDRDAQIISEPLDPSELEEVLSADKDDRSAEEWDLIELAAEKWLSRHDSDLERAAADLWRADNPKQSVFDCDGETKAHYRRLALECSNWSVQAQAERPPSMRDNFSDDEIAAAFRDQKMSELLVLRARVAQLEAALEKAQFALLFGDKEEFSEALDAIDAAPQGHAPIPDRSRGQVSGEVVSLSLVPLDPDLDEDLIEGLLEEHEGDIRKIARKLGVKSRRLRKFVAKSARLIEACEEVWECAVDQSVSTMFEGLRDAGSFQNRFYAAKEFLRTGAARKRGFGHELSGQATLELKDKGGAKTITLRWLEPREEIEGPDGE